MINLPRRSADEDEFSEEIRAANGGEHSDHGGDGVTDVGTALDGEGVENVEQVVDVGVQSGVAAEIEVIGVDAAGANEVAENDGVSASEVRENSLPSRLVGAEAVSENEDFVFNFVFVFFDSVFNFVFVFFDFFNPNDDDVFDFWI